MNNAPAAIRYTGKQYSKYSRLTGYFKIFVSPFVLLLYPVWIIPVTFGLGIYGGFSQVSWYWPNWRKELTDPEKGDWLTPWCLEPFSPFCSGFFGWLCNKLRIPDCSPYQVVILTSLGNEDPNTLTSVIWNIQKFYQNLIMLLLAIWLTFKTKSAFRIYLLPTSLVRVNSTVDDRKTDILPKIYVHIWSQNF